MPKRVKQGRPFGGVPRQDLVRISINLFPRQIKALDKNGGNRSEIVRDVLDEYLDEYLKGG